MLARDRLPHALLLSGPAGVGKYTLAQMLAKTLHCENREDNFCGECRSCRLIAMADDRRAAVEEAEQEREKISRRPREIPLLIQHHPDVLLLPPNGPLRLFQIEQARHLKQALAFQPAAGRKKIFVLPEIERMDAAAANSLLKSLEEPPAHCLLLLTATSEAALLPTIRSRCVSFWLSPLPERLVLAFLEKRGAGANPQDRRLRASLARGCPGRAVRLDPERYRQIQHSLLSILQAGVEGKNFGSLFAEARKLAGDKEGLENLLDVLYSLLQDVLHFEASPNGESFQNADRPKLFWQVARSLGVGGAMQAAALLNQVEKNLRRNVPTQISLEAFAIGLVPLRRMS
ncbi:MAG: AAA family ATPase [Acidobacteria bacterium]|nr:AAA family ATPase [Acidobacteriota bacterium]